MSKLFEILQKIADFFIGDASKASTKNAYVVTVGVENGFAGKCAGSSTDYSNMKSLLKQFAKTQVSLVDKTATKAAVSKALSDAVKSNLAIFYFSGHGTHTKATSDKTEVDGEDEYICCYDTVMADNEIWSIISQSKGRVVLIFDCCHSGTMYRAPSAVTMQKMCAQPRAQHKVDGPISMLCWSGCPDNTYSWGSKSGGYMTNALRKYFSKSLTYDKLWKKIEADKSVKKYEIVQQTKMGKDFGSKKVFQ